MTMEVTKERAAAMSNARHLKRKSPPSEDPAGFTGYRVLYDARAARRGAATTVVARGGATLATFARAVVRALAVKQRSSARSTRASMAGADSRITSDTSEMIRNFARSSIRFSRNERLLDFARNVRLLSTSATS